MFSLLFASLALAAPFSIGNGFPGLNMNQYLNQAAQSSGKICFGSAVAIPGNEQQDSNYMAILNNTNEFGQITPTYSMKVGTSHVALDRKSVV